MWDLMGNRALVTNSIPFPATACPDMKVATARLSCLRRASPPCAAAAFASTLMSFAEFIPLQNHKKIPQYVPQIEKDGICVILAHGTV